MSAKSTELVHLVLLILRFIFSKRDLQYTANEADSVIPNATCGKIKRDITRPKENESGMKVEQEQGGGRGWL